MYSIYFKYIFKEMFVYFIPFYYDVDNVVESYNNVC